VNPAVDRAVARPLVYNMGQRVHPFNFGDPVLPMPYSDEGAAIEVSASLVDATQISFSGYVVNGLKGGQGGVDFFASRDHLDNNRNPAVGGRLAIGGQYLRLGGSVMGGRFNTEDGTGPLNESMEYIIFGADVTVRWEDIFRAQLEYVQRNSDRLGNVPETRLFEETVAGGFGQAELLVSRRHAMSLFFRYDTQVHQSLLPPLGSPLPTGDFRLDRLTYGVNWSLPGGSLLMVNLEQWNLPLQLDNVNVFGVRWAGTF
jgi:hypothetical protein